MLKKRDVFDFAEKVVAPGFCVSKIGGFRIIQKNLIYTYIHEYVYTYYFSVTQTPAWGWVQNTCYDIHKKKRSVWSTPHLHVR